MKNIIITGGAGFLGFNLLTFLINNQKLSKIIIIDNFITSDCQRLYDFIKKNKLNDKIIVIKEDISNKEIITIITQQFDVIDEIYHLASIASPPLYKKYFINTLDVGYNGTKNMLEICLYYHQKNIKCKLLYTSTSEVYGDALEHPQKETYYGNVNCYGERAVYDEAKRIGETLIYVYHKNFGLNTKIVRIFNTYGPYMNLEDGRIITEIIKSILNKQTLKIYGDGNQTRSLCYVNDTIFMMCEVMSSQYNNPVNIGNDDEISINNLVNKIKHIMKSDCHIEYIPMEKDDPKMRKPCLDLISSIKGFYSKTSLETGLVNTISYFYKSLKD